MAISRIAAATSSDECRLSSTSSFGSRLWSRMTTRSASSRTMSSGRRSTEPPPKRGLMREGLCAFVPRSQVARLLLGQLVDLDAHRGELDARDLAVDLLRHDVNLPLELACMVDDELGGERLVREAHVHHRRGVALGRAEVDEPPVGDEVDAPS